MTKLFLLPGGLGRERRKGTTLTKRTIIAALALAAVAAPSIALAGPDELGRSSPRPYTSVDDLARQRDDMAIRPVPETPSAPADASCRSPLGLAWINAAGDDGRFKQSFFQRRLANSFGAGRSTQGPQGLAGF